MIHLFYLTPLLTNAIHYCSKPGTIQISLDASQFVIANTGAPLNIRDEQIFNRFKKEQQSSDSLGLGLSIVKKICDLYNFHIQYVYQEVFIALKLFCKKMQSTSEVDSIFFLATYFARLRLAHATKIAKAPV